MKRRTLGILGVLILAVLISLVSSPRNVGSHTDKYVMVFNFHYDHGDITLNDMDIKKGIAPDYRAEPAEGYIFNLLSRHGNVIDSFKFLPPIKLSIDYIDTVTGELTGKEIIRDEFDFVLRVPYIRGTSGFEIKTKENAAVFSDNLDKNVITRFHRIAIPANNCKRLIYNGDPEYKIDVLIIPDNFTEEELESFPEIAMQHIDPDDEYEGILSREPIQTDQQKFNFYYIDEYNILYCDSSYSYCYSEALELAEQCDAWDEIIVLVNNDDPWGWGWGYIGDHFAVSSAFAEYRPAPGITSHEFGHSWGNLADEYINLNPISKTYLANCDIANTTQACADWCDGEPAPPNPSSCFDYFTEEDCESASGCLWLQEPDPYFGYQCIPDTNFQNIGTECMEGTGCYWNCHGTNGWRPTYDDCIMFTIRSIDNEFDPVDQRALGNILNQYPLQPNQAKALI